jgi:hypothetical protein
MRVPKLVDPVTTAVPEFVMLPPTSGVPELGLTRMFENVILDCPDPLESRAEMVKVIVLEAGVTVADANVSGDPLPETSATVPVTL